MANAVCRTGDITQGTCLAIAFGHPRQFTGIWMGGSSGVTADGIGVIKTDDVGITDCGHHFIAAVGSDTVQSDGLGVVRVGDPVIVLEGGYGVAVTGADTVTSG
jgi:hypothetical protein